MFASTRAFIAIALSVLIISLYAMPLYAGKHYIMPADQRLSQGRVIWMSSCETCHGYGVADAPIPMNPNEWSPRLNKGKRVLYEHAISGFIGPDYSMMPARGGNDELTDEEVRLAVDYMVFLASYYINKHDINEEENYDSTTN